MMNMLESIMSAGVNPVLSDILTQENVEHNKMIQNTIYFCADPDPVMPETPLEEMAHAMLSVGHDWSVEHMRGIMVGIIMGLTTDDIEVAELFRLLNSLIVEKSVK
tara:strand:- start:115 stop:432 length:318 start_codon:yes stop_codon:yes gene_type:complete